MTSNTKYKKGSIEKSSKRPALNLSYAFSLVEVMIFIAVISVFFVTGLSVVTYSIQNMRSDEYKIKASQYAEGLMEWIRAQKEISWTEFVTNTVGTGKEYCFNMDLSTISSFPAEGSCTANDYSLASDYNQKYASLPIYKRNVQLVPDAAPPNTTKVEVNITVVWKDGSGINSVPLRSALTVWE